MFTACFLYKNKKPFMLLYRRLSNGPIEGINSIIEKINVNGNGYTNFYRFRNRIIYSINKNVPLKIK